MAAHPEIAQVNRVLEVTVPAPCRELSDLVTSRFVCYKFATATTTPQKCDLLCFFLPSFSMFGAGVSACPFQGSGNLSICRALCDPLLKANARTKFLKHKIYIPELK